MHPLDGLIPQPRQAPSLEHITLTIADAARIYQVAERTLRRWVADGLIPNQEPWNPSLDRPRRYVVKATDVETQIRRVGLAGGKDLGLE